MTTYATTLQIESPASLRALFGESNSRERGRTHTSQTRANAARYSHTQFAHYKFYAETSFEVFDATAPVSVDPVPDWYAATGITQTVNGLVIVTEVNPKIESEGQRNIDQIAHERMMLLARKYSNRGTIETLARLERLNRLLSEKSPRIKDEQIAALERTQDLLQRSEAERMERIRRRAERKKELLAQA